MTRVNFIKRKIIFAIVVLITTCFPSCQKELSCEGCTTNPTGNTNKPLIAVAGPDQSITLPTDSVSLDGSSSSDPES